MTYKMIFEKYRNIAVYGMSKNPLKPSNTVPMYFMEHGFNIIPINPTIDEINGKKSYPKLIDVPDEIEVLDVFRPSADCLDVVREAVERKNIKGDIHLIWLQEGIVNEEARKLAESNGIEFVQDKCMYKEYVRA